MLTLIYLVGPLIVEAHQQIADEAVVEELMKLMKTNSEANGSLMIVGNESSDTKNWMNSVQLWNVETKQVNLKNRFFFW